MLCKHTFKYLIIHIYFDEIERLLHWVNQGLMGIYCENRRRKDLFSKHDRIHRPPLQHKKRCKWWSF